MCPEIIAAQKARILLRLDLKRQTNEKRANPPEACPAGQQCPLGHLPSAELGFGG